MPGIFLGVCEKVSFQTDSPTSVGLFSRAEFMMRGIKFLDLQIMNGGL